MQQHIHIPFTVKAEALPEVKGIIREFLRQIRRNEPDTLLYHSYQEQAKPTRFVHIMSFSDEAAMQFHRQTAHCRAFVAALYPLCSEAPQAMAYHTIE